MFTYMYTFMYIYMYVHTYIYIHVCMYNYIKIRRVSPKRCQDQIASSSASMLPYSVLKKPKTLHHCYMCTPPNTFHRLYLPFFLLSANVCVYHIAYTYSRPHSPGNPHPPQNTHKGSNMCILGTQRPE